MKKLGILLLIAFTFTSLAGAQTASEHVSVESTPATANEADERSEHLEVSADSTAAGPAEPSPEPTSTPAPTPQPQAKKDVDESASDAIPSVVSHAVQVRERDVFKIFSPKGEEDQAAQQARLASRNLDSALESPPSGANAERGPRLEISGGYLEIWVNGSLITRLSRSQAQAAGFQSLKEYSDSLSPQLKRFYSEYSQRLKWQGLARQVFLTIFFVLLAAILFRQLHRLFDRAEDALGQRKEAMQPIYFLSEPLISAEALSALLSITLVLLRFLSYILLTIATVIAIFSQFGFSQELLSQFASESFRRLIGGVQDLVEGLPGLLLALVLILVLQATLRFINLFLRNVSSGRLSLEFLHRQRVPAARFWTTVLALLLFVPLIFSAAFSEMFTPLQVIVLLGAFALALSLVPILANWAVGSYILWRGLIREGHWIEIGQYHGEVSRMDLDEAVIVPEDGGIIRVPMYYFLFKPFHDRPEVPKLELKVRIRKKGTMRETLDLISSLFPKEWSVEPIVHSMSAHDLVLILRARKFQTGTREGILEILSNASDSGKILLTDDLVEDIVH